MGFFQSIFGSNTGAGFQAGGVNQQDLNQSRANIGNTMEQQNALLQALQGQGGIQNQNAALQGLQGVAGQYQGVANGTGPNPAQAMLNQQTGQNVAQQASLMAGQRGAGANVGLLARQAGQQGGAIQQQAVGQGASMQAQQQLAGLQGLSNARENIANLSTQQVGQQMAAQQSLANTALGNQGNIYGLQSNINTTNAGIAAGNQKAQAGLVGGVLGSVGAASGGASSGGSNVAAHGGMVEGYAGGGNIITPNAAANSPTQSGPQSSFGKFIQAGFSPQAGGQLNQDTGASLQQGGAGLYKMGKAAYGAGKSLYDKMYPVSNGTVPSAPSAVAAKPGMDTELPGASSEGAAAGTEAAEAAGADTAAEEEGADLLELLAAGGQIQGTGNVPIEKGYGAKVSDPSTVGGTIGDVMGYLNARGGVIQDRGGVDVRVSPGEKIIPPGKAQKAAGGQVEAKTVPGKAKVPGDDTANDTVKTKLAPGTIVVPRTKSKNAKDSAEFVRSVLAKRGKK